MHFPYPSTEGLNSYTVPKKELEAIGCFTILNVRRSIHEPRCDHALQALKNDMHNFYENPCDVLPSTENKINGNWVALAMPSAIPSRLGLMTRISSLMILREDAEQRLSLPTKGAARIYTTLFASDLEAAFSDLSIDRRPSTHHMTKSTMQSSRARAVIDLVNPIIRSLLSADSTSGLEVINAWRSHHLDLKIASEPPASLAEYLVVCDRNLPSKPWMVLLRHALGLHLHEKELEMIQPTAKAALQSVALTRDYWAWPKISRDKNNKKRVGNAVAVLMGEHGCAEAKALNLVRDAAVAAEERFLDLKVDIIDEVEEGQSEVVMFLDAVEQFAGGNSLWCSSCPRFHGRR